MPADAGINKRKLQSLFVRCLGELIRYANERGYELTLAEGYVLPIRKSRDGGEVEDGVHMRKSLHYERLAQDLNLFVDNVFIRHSEHFAWRDLGDKWLSLSPSCRWGGSFASPDANHFSVEWEGRA